MKKIAISGNRGAGLFALVDDDDYDSLSKNKWCLSTNGYATRKTERNGKQIVFRMHRIVNKTPIGLFTDHINGNKLDNRKQNLRNCTKSQNSTNRPLQKNNTLGAKGIHVHTDNRNTNPRKYFEAQLKCNRKTIYLGRFKTIREASVAYNQGAIKYFGEFAQLNEV